MTSLARLIFPVLACFSAGAQAQSGSYPARPVKVLVGYEAGGSVDTVARRMAAQLQTELGQSFVVENKPGAGGVLSAAQLAKAPADGYTIALQASPTRTIAPFFNSNIAFDPLKGYTPISSVVETGFAVLVTPDFPARTLPEMIAHLKAHPGKVAYGTAGVGSSVHLATEVFMKATGTQMLHVPYKGVAPVLNELVAGRLQVTFMAVGTAMTQIKAGKVRALAVTSSQRDPGLPDLPTVSEAGVPGFEASNWHGFEGPPGLPRDVVDKLNAAIRKALSNPTLVKTFADSSLNVIPSTPETMGARLAREYAMWGDVIKTLDTKAN